ncbi:UNVERIFIED_CONTAM: hypothetical protein GTU68_020696 [Idotea baltica]|nr:hypothetical protein [Idotea baltica]
MIEVIPAIDLINGECVRLEKGAFDTKKVYSSNPLELAKQFEDIGVKKLHLVDLDGAKEGKPVNLNILENISNNTNLKIDFGGGIKNKSDLDSIFNAGASQVTIGSLAYKNKDLFLEFLTHFGSEKIILAADAKNKFASRFGSQCVVLAIDTKFNGNDWEVYVKGGREATGLDTLTWAKEVVERGAGEILLTSMNNDGTKKGFAIDITRELSENLSVPIVASGGAGKMDHFDEVFKDGLADAALAASIFHFGEIAIPDLKKYLINKDIPIRL